MRLWARYFRVLSPLFLFVLPLCHASAQTQQTPSFDVVSIHRMPPGDTTPEHITNPPRNGSFVAVSVPLKSLMEVAYDMPDTRMVGGPGWLATERWSVSAKSDPTVDEEIAHLPPEQARQTKRDLLKSMLQSRFQLAVHTEMRDMAVYALVAAGDGAKRRNGETEAAGTDRITIRAGRDSLAILAYELSWRLGRPVLNKTGTVPTQALLLQWRDDSDTSSDTTAPPLRDALRDQLGLKLEATRASVPVLVIDHAEKPSDDN